MFCDQKQKQTKKKTCLRIASRNAAWGLKTKSPGNQGKCSYLIWCGLKLHVCSTSWESPPPVTQCIVVSLKSSIIKYLFLSFSFELKIIQKIWQKSRHQKIIKIRKKTEAKLTNGDVVKDEFIHTVKSQINNHTISWIIQAIWLVLTYDLSEERRINDLTINNILFLIIKQIDSLMLWVCSVRDHRWHQNGVRTTVTHLAAPHAPIFYAYHIPMWSVIYNWTDALQHGIYISLWIPKKAQHVVKATFVEEKMK